jgi:small-conductance mechanosensitive channel
MQNFREILGRIVVLNEEVIFSLIVTLIIIAIAMVANFAVRKVLQKQISDEKQRFLWKKNIRYTIGFIAFFLIGRLWLDGFQSLATFLGLLSAGLAIALKDVVADFAAWLYLLWRKPFHIGDRVQIGDQKGDVIDMRVFKFTLVEIGNWVNAEQSTGRVVHVPNHRVLLDPIANYTSGFEFIWNELEVNLTFNSDWKKAKEILLKIAQKHSSEVKSEAERQIRRTAQEYMIVFKHLTPMVYTSVNENGVLLSVRYITHPRMRRGSSQLIWEDILTEFAKHDDIHFSYNTIRYLDGGMSKEVFSARNASVDPKKE